MNTEEKYQHRHTVLCLFLIFPPMFCFHSLCLSFIIYKAGKGENLECMCVIDMNQPYQDARSLDPAQRHGKPSGSSVDVDSVWRKYPPLSPRCLHLEDCSSTETAPNEIS